MRGSGYSEPVSAPLTESNRRGEPTDSRDQPHISIVVPHYGDPTHAAQLLKQLIVQAGAPAFEIIVVDDCSPRAFTEEHVPVQSSGEPVAIRVIRHEQNGGFGTAVNTGAKAARGTYLLILNSDLDITETFLADLDRAAAPWQPAIAAPALVGDDGEPQWSGRHFPTTKHYVTEWLRPLARWRSTRILHEAVGHDTRCVPGTTVATDWLVGAVLLLPTELFLSEGGFDERFHMYCEETDLQRRLSDRSIPAMYLGDLQVRHAGGASTDSSKRLGWLFASRFFYQRKWHKSATGMRAGLIAAAGVNAIFNGLHRFTGKGDWPVATLRKELEIINTAAREAKRRTSAGA